MIVSAVNNGKIRQSNIELLRILAMFLVLVVHADFFSLGFPTPTLCNDSPQFAIGQFFFESISICCVNVFILISGWFGIHPTIKSFLNFAFQCLFFLIGIYLLCIVLGIADLSSKGISNGIAGCFCLLTNNWFIKAYIGLYILAPILNAFVEHSNKKEFARFLILFFCFQTIYSWASGAAVFFENGYSTMSFIGLYMLARYTKLYSPKWSLYSFKSDLMIFTGVVLFQTFFSFFMRKMGSPAVANFYFYDNPLIIIQSLSLLLCFSKLSIQNRVINWIAASSFAVFLLHTNPNLCEPFFSKPILEITENSQGIMMILKILLFLIITFIIAIVIDQIRIFCWKKIYGKFERK